MLSKVLKVSLEQRLQDIDMQMCFIKDKGQHNFVRDAIYKKTNMHKVKLVPFHYCHVIKEFEPVLQARINISSIVFLMKYVSSINKFDEDTLQCFDIIYEIYGCLKESLREMGSPNPPYKTGTYLQKDDILKSANIILSRFSRPFDNFD
jgi:hypothetical protein